MQLARDESPSREHVVMCQKLYRCLYIPQYNKASYVFILLMGTDSTLRLIVRSDRDKKIFANCILNTILTCLTLPLVYLGPTTAIESCQEGVMNRQFTINLANLNN
jgi:hypothetical protein